MSKSKNVLCMKVQEGWSLEKVQALAAYAYLAVQLMPDKTPANIACARRAKVGAQKVSSKSKKVAKPARG